MRVSLGCIFFYAGLTKILNPAWSAAGLLNTAKTLPGLYHWFASPGVIGVVNVVNEWSLLLLGVSLLLGLFVGLSSRLGIVLVALYYLAQFDFPYVGKNYFIIDEHVIFVIGLILLIQASAGRVWGMDGWCAKQAWSQGRLKALLM